MTLNTIPDLPPPESATAAGPAPAPAPVFLSPRQLAAALGVSRRTLTNWTQRHVIPSVCVGRVRRYELEQVREALRAHGAGSSSSGHSTETGTTAIC